MSISRHGRVNTKAVPPSPYYRELLHHETDPEAIRFPQFDSTDTDAPPIEITYSELATFLDCAMAYRLRNVIGFKPRVAPELGYGKAVHHVVRTVAQRTQATGDVPDQAAIEDILDADFFLPTERPFELHLDGITVIGRADVILDKEDGVPGAMAILDYKSSTRQATEAHLQLQVYSDAGRREGIDVKAA